MAVTGQQIIDKARTALGVQYVWGGNSLSSGVDCSGLVQQVFASFGIQLPRVTYDQINQGASVPIGQLQPGDLVFFDTEPGNKGADHVGIYIGGGKFIHAPHTGDVVKISSLTDSYYANRWMGGRRIPGVGSAGSASGTAFNAGSAATAQPEVHLSASELADQYGMSYAFFKSQPDLMKLLTQAVGEQWTPTVFQAHLKNTTWWKDNSDTSRKAQVQAQTDPATYKANLAAAQFAASQAAVKVGAILTTKQTAQLAKNIVNFGWNDAQVNNFLGQYIDFQANHTLAGQAGSAAKQISQYAYDQGVRMSDQTVKNNAAYLVRGITTMQGVQDAIRQQAISTYPGWTEQLQGGATMRDLAQPYIQQTAQELELPESSIDVWHPKVLAAINAADAKGVPAPMSLSDYRDYLRADPAWRGTTTARDQAMSVGRQVLSSLGLVT